MYDTFGERFFCDMGILPMVFEFRSMWHLALARLLDQPLANSRAIFDPEALFEPEPQPATSSVESSRRQTRRGITVPPVAGKPVTHPQASVKRNVVNFDLEEPRARRNSGLQAGRVAMNGSMRLSSSRASSNACCSCNRSIARCRKCAARSYWLRYLA